jgi:hypothetical protein
MSTPYGPDSTGRPCRYCLAAYPTVADDTCMWEHRDEPRIYELATAMARIFQQPEPTDEQVCWFLSDADVVIDDFKPAPEEWKLHKLPDDFSEFSEFTARFQINGITYVVPDGEGHMLAIRLSTLRKQQRDAEREAS